MDLTDMHRALERLDAVLVAPQAALDENPALPAARHAYLEAYAEARSAQGHPARAATTAEESREMLGIMPPPASPPPQGPCPNTSA